MADYTPVNVGVLHDLLRYDADTGKLHWRHRPRQYFKCERDYLAWNAQRAGREALTALDSNGYCNGAIFNRRYKAHRVAFAIHHGRWPEQQIDHINRIKTDNRAENLRDCSGTVNKRNIGRRSNNKSGITGVCWSRGRWRASITIQGKSKHLGMFKRIEDAVAARKTAETGLYGYD